jgi:hypothetical protein
MSKIIKGILFSVLLSITYTSIILPILKSNNLLNEMVFTLEEVNNGVYFAKLIDVPLLICDVKVYIVVKLSTFLKIICELTLGNNIFQFCLNDMSLSYHVEQGRLQLEGEVSKFGVGSFKATVNTDGLIQGVPKLVLYYLA